MSDNNPHPNPLPQVPPKALVVSMAMRMRHDFGLNRDEGDPISCGMTNPERNEMLNLMLSLYEEVAGYGYYKWDGSVDEDYKNLLNANV